MIAQIKNACHRQADRSAYYMMWAFKNLDAVIGSGEERNKCNVAILIFGLYNIEILRFAFSSRRP